MTYAVVTPIVKRAGAYQFNVFRPTDPPIHHTYETRDLAWLGRHGWISYYRGRHVSVKAKFDA